MDRFAVVLLILPAFALAVVSMGADEPEANKGDAQILVKGNNQFAFDLYGKLRAQPGNLFFSPFSISTALGMTYAGSRGQTAEEMAKTLHFTLDRPQLYGGFAQLVTQFRGQHNEDRPYQLDVANALWGQEGYHFLPPFVDICRKDFGAAVKEVDFQKQSEQARQTINAWVEKQTHDKIKDLLAPGVLDESTRLVLTNAIYFKSHWEHTFSEMATRKEVFHVSAEQKADDVPLMHQKRNFDYFENGALQALELPYQGHDLSMTVLLPKQVEGLAELENALTPASLAEIQNKLRPFEVDVSLPRFKVTSEFTLNRTLADMGMSLAFSQSADFSGMSERDKLYLSAAVHKAYVAVDERGTEAAAATGIAVGLVALPAPRPKAVFRADHPFAFVIRDRATGSVLFMGRLVKP